MKRNRFPRKWHLDFVPLSSYMTVQIYSISNKKLMDFLVITKPNSSLKAITILTHPGSCEIYYWLVILLIVVSKGWTTWQLDINETFWHADLWENIYMLEPPRLRDETCPSYICKLQILMQHIHGLIIKFFVHQFYQIWKSVR